VSLLTPCCRMVAAHVVALAVSAVVSWLSLHAGSAHVPQNSRQQQVLSGTPVSRMSIMMLLPPAHNMWESAALGTFAWAACWIFARASGRVKVRVLDRPLRVRLFGLSSLLPGGRFPFSGPRRGLSSSGVSGWVNVLNVLIASLMC